MRVSVVIPVYNSEALVQTTVSQTVFFFENRKIDYQLVLVNDRSSDSSWEKIRSLAAANSNIMAIDLLKNYGQHTAVFCGLAHATGDFVVTMDDDMQDPPEEIIHLINKIQEGYDAVFAKFKEKKHSLLRRLGSKLIGYLNEKIFSKPRALTLTNFRIIRREVVQRIVNFRTNFPYIPGLVLMFSSKVANVEVEHRARTIGKSNYGMIRILQLVARLLFSYSSYPLKFLTALGFVISFSSFALGIIYFFRAVLSGTSVPGWPTVVVLLSFLNGFTIVLLGVIGEYVTRILNQVSYPQPYQLREVFKA